MAVIYPYDNTSHSKNIHPLKEAVLFKVTLCDALVAQIILVMLLKRKMERSSKVDNL